MDGFTYHNIFQTKGIEYIIIIAFLLLLVPFWLLINRRKEIVETLRKAVGFTFELLRVPRGVHYSRNHTWAYLSKDGTAEIGLDDFLLQLTGEVRISTLKKEGDEIARGELLTEIGQDGKILRVHSPVSGKIVAVNESLLTEGLLQPENAYTDGWIYRIQPSAWKAETQPYFIGEEAVAWLRGETLRIKDFLAVSSAKNHGSMVVLQEGGELRKQPLSEMPCEVWNDFQKEFLDQL